ncbi:MAG: hypothetical protein V1895_03970, partial [Parcubacteria group bacterium]
VHTYNFRSGHSEQPWNEFNPEAAPFSPTGELVGTPRFTNRGKQLELEVQYPSKTTTYRFDFACRQQSDPDVPNDKPCVWSSVLN